jgi:heptosyltransferase III
MKNKLAESEPLHIIISRVDNIGDVVLTLPVAGVLKEKFPGCRISFLAKKYTRPVIEACVHVDAFIDWEEISQMSPALQLDFFKNLKANAIIHVFPNQSIALLAWKAKIKNRIGTVRRSYNLIYCNKTINLGRKKSELHEAQLNLKLLKFFGIEKEFSLAEVSGYFGLNRTAPLPEKLQSAISSDRFNLVLHPKSKGSAREWGMKNFTSLIEMLPRDRYNIFVTGSEEEGNIVFGFLEKYKEKITDLTGKLSLEEFVSLLEHVDGVVAASTGPLHIAAAMGKHAIGIYAPMRPIFPTRWAPVGTNACFLVLDKKCNDCRRSRDCVCIRSIKPEQVFEKLEAACQKKFICELV